MISCFLGCDKVDKEDILLQRMRGLLLLSPHEKPDEEECPKRKPSGVCYTDHQATVGSSSQRLCGECPRNILAPPTVSASEVHLVRLRCEGQGIRAAGCQLACLPAFPGS
ncbi:hypothetical protein AGIG_G2167 [Arapaima gigas]